jgi:hypothetical protein
VGTYFFRVLEVLKEGVLVPGDALVHVGGSVGEAICLTGLAAKDTRWTKRQARERTEDGDTETSKKESEYVSKPRNGLESDDIPVEVGADLVSLTSTDGVALRATGFEEGSTLASVTYEAEKTVRVRPVYEYAPDTLGSTRPNASLTACGGY